MKKIFSIWRKGKVVISYLMLKRNLVLIFSFDSRCRIKEYGSLNRFEKVFVILLLFFIKVIVIFNYYLVER